MIKLRTLGGAETFDVPDGMWESALHDAKVDKWQAAEVAKDSRWRETGMSPMSIEMYEERLKKPAEELAEAAIRYLHYRASLGRGSGRRWPYDTVDYERWVRLGGEKFFPEYGGEV